ncbi:uncharacterized protein A4U43_C10F16450, partial [Asparagus officinalis]
VSQDCRGRQENFGDKTADDLYQALQAFLAQGASLGQALLDHLAREKSTKEKMAVTRGWTEPRGFCARQVLIGEGEEVFPTVGRQASAIFGKRLMGVAGRMLKCSPGTKCRLEIGGGVILARGGGPPQFVEVTGHGPRSV